jgi:hypothetical protein
MRPPAAADVVVIVVVVVVVACPEPASGGAEATRVELAAGPRTSP